MLVQAVMSLCEGLKTNVRSGLGLLKKFGVGVSVHLVCIKERIARSVGASSDELM